MFPNFADFKFRLFFYYRANLAEFFHVFLYFKTIKVQTNGCSRLQTPFEYATKVCSKYAGKVSGLSGIGMQLSPTKGIKCIMTGDDVLWLDDF